MMLTERKVKAHSCWLHKIKRHLTVLGLSAAVFTADIQIAEAFGEQLKLGTISRNGASFTDLMNDIGTIASVTREWGGDAKCVLQG